MKKLLLPLLILSMTFGLQAQQLFFEISSGYNITAYEGANFSEASGFVPIRARLAGGLEHVQLGVEYDIDLTRPEFNFQDPVSQQLVGVDFENYYYGLFVRGNLSSLPAYRFGVVLSAGMGFYNTKPNYFSLPAGVEIEQIPELDKTLGYNFRIGVSSPIYTLLHWEIGYQFNYMNYEKDINQDLLLQPFQPYYHSIQAGLSLNMVFGNVEKKCRRIMGGNRSRKGW